MAKRIVKKKVNSKKRVVKRIVKNVATRQDVSAATKKRAIKKYGNVEFADPKNDKYPLNSYNHVRAAIAYFGMPKNKVKYSESDRKAIASKIYAAAKGFGINVSDEWLGKNNILKSNGKKKTVKKVAKKAVAKKSVKKNIKKIAKKAVKHNPKKCSSCGFPLLKLTSKGDGTYTSSGSYSKCPNCGKSVKKNPAKTDTSKLTKKRAPIYKPFNPNLEVYDPQKRLIAYYPDKKEGKNVEYRGPHRRDTYKGYRSVDTKKSPKIKTKYGTASEPIISTSGKNLRTFAPMNRKVGTKGKLPSGASKYMHEIIDTLKSEGIGIRQAVAIAYAKAAKKFKDIPMKHNPAIFKYISNPTPSNLKALKGVSNAEIESAGKMYKKFTGHEPDWIDELDDKNLPSFMKGKMFVKIADADAIQYKSDKWHKGKHDYYKHDFGKDNELLTTPEGDALIVINKKGKLKVKPEGIVG